MNLALNMAEVPIAARALLGFRPFSGKQLHRIIDDSSSRHAIYGCFAAQHSMRELIEDAEGKVSKRVIRRYDATRVMVAAKI